MARKSIIRTSEHPYHWTARSNNKDFFNLDMPSCWNIFNYYLNKTVDKYELDIHAFVLMSNHFHLMLSTPNENVDAAARYFLSSTSKGIGMASKRMNHLYGGPYKWKLLTNPYAYANMIKYVYRNPVRAGIVKTVDSYPWSTINKTNLKYKVLDCDTHSSLLPEDHKERIEWFNEAPLVEADESIKKAILRNGVFKDPKNVITKLKL